MKAVFNISLPTSWDELTDKQLLMVYGLFARDLSSAEVKTLCLMKWNHLKLLATLPDKRSIMKIEGEQEVVLTVRQILQATTVLDFLDSFPPMPVRIARIGKHHALPADFEKVPFEQYLYVDNLFQGYLHTQQEELLLQMAQVLYGSDSVKPSKAHLVVVFYWMAALKQYFAQQFPNFYKPAPAIDNMEARQRCMDMMRELFRQFMSVLILEQTKLQEHCIYLDPRISFASHSKK